MVIFAGRMFSRVTNRLTKPFAELLTNDHQNGEPIIFSSNDENVSEKTYVYYILMNTFEEDQIKMACRLAQRGINNMRFEMGNLISNESYYKK